MNLKCDYEISGQGSLDLSLSEVDDLTPEAVEAWLVEGAEMDVIEQHRYSVRLRPRYSHGDLLRAIEAEKAERGDEP